MTARIINSTEDFIQFIKEHREGLGLTHADVDHMVGWQDAYASKVEGGDRVWGKRPFSMTVNARDLLQALGLRVVIMPADDADRIADANTERRISQIARGGQTPRKGKVLTCTIKRNKISR